jgi:metal-responsive CopG/Arc/MetJ family transcriptional regulator
LSLGYDKIILLTNERKPPMISTAIAIQDATGNAVVDISSMMRAKFIYDNHNTMTQEELTQALWDYSTHLASLTATLVTHACLTESQLNDMMNTIEEMEALGKDLPNGN